MALVILSGGQDSTTCLYWAMQQFDEVSAVTFDYGQRHLVELRAAEEVARLAGVPHEVVRVGDGILASTSPLVNGESEVGQYDGVDALPGGVEPTFIPGRNALFLVLAANRAVSQGKTDLVTGVCEEDFGGYPDCRAAFIHRMALALTEGFFDRERDQRSFKVWTPLMRQTKAQSVSMAATLPGCMDALAYSHTCYRGECPPCGKCHACLLRARGFHDAGRTDPLIQRLKRQGVLPADHPDHGLDVQPIQ